MRLATLWRPALALAGALTLAGCYDDGYYGVGAGYGYYGDGYYGDYADWYGPGYGWWDGYYYPGGGFFVYDREGHRHHMRDSDRDHWHHGGGGNWNGGHGNWQNHAGNWQGRSGNWQGGSGGNWQHHWNGQGGQMSAPRMSSPRSGGGGGWSGWRSRGGH